MTDVARTLLVLTACLIAGVGIGALGAFILTR